MNCPYCGFYIEEALQLQYGVGDIIKCPNCNCDSIIETEDIYLEDGETDSIFYLGKLT